MKTLYLVDASAMFYRAFFALPPLTNPKGMQTNALYGFMSMTIKLLRDEKPDYIAYCFDRSERTFRNELFEDYKATREEMPDELKPQIPYMRKLTDALGLFSIDMLGYEADDLIGSMAHWGRKSDLNVFIVSGDKDFSQLVKPCITLYDTMKDTRLDPQGVLAKWGVTPEQMIDYLAIVGDTSDNIPGVKGVGPKGACKLLSEFGTLDGIYENIDKVTGESVKTKMKEHKKSAYLARKLVTIVNDLDLGIKLDDLKLQTVDQQKLTDLLQELGFKTFEKTLMSMGEVKKSGAKEKSTKSDAPFLPPAPTPVPKAKKSKSSELADWEADLTAIQKNIEPYSEIWAVWSDRGPILASEDKVIRTNEDMVEVGKILLSKRLKWKGWDLKEIFKCLKISGEVIVWDGKLAAYVVRPEKMGTFDDIYSRYLNETLPPMASPVQIITAHRDLEKALKEEVKSLNAEKVFEEFDLPLISPLARMETLGIRIDTEELKRQSLTLATDIKKLEQSIHEAAGGSFNIASPKQLGEILFVKLKLPPAKKTKTGFSTDSDVLEGLKDKHAIAAHVLDFRELSKLKSTYVDSLPSLVNSETKRVHTQMNQTLTTTGRLSSSNPNLQNIPIRTERGRMIRKAFVADKGNILISADYSQIELRVLAHMADDNAMISAFKEDLDIHAATAAEIFSVPLKSVTTEHRRTAKAVNFGIAYGQGPVGLAQVLGISRTEGTEIIDRYFKRFSKIKQFMEDTVRTALETGFVETLFGRRRYVIELKSQNQMIRRAGERAAVNAPIQGTAADLVKLAMIRLNSSLDIPILLQVHDELLFECPEGDCDVNAAEIRKTMESIHPMKVPLKVNVATGCNWEDAHG